ncbi:Mov34/MPN/PAD-1 family protein [Microdochium bolleyi]|uniref:COP9 signalosome complex subunit 5 n=1 Tax=Microdochium bolleyi TaxID=196109 RepID=A0A136JBK2_9PEZI|nr:Mov34/MPN/PAD-1 family protein [Microdochium bolleyi]
MEVAMKSWEVDNDIELVDPVRDALYNYDNERQKQINAEKPWRKDPKHFKHVRVSAVALIKMVMHARSGGSIEVMGLMQGHTDGDTIVVTDAFGLPVEGTETRVNAQDDANEYMVQYLQLSRDQGARQENVVGWYHSHPGYGCWLSGIDVATQKLQQTFNDPFVAVVIDPDRTISAGRVEIGAFRTFPDDYKDATNSSSGGGGNQAVPLAKAEDFGAHASKYYPLEVSHFKSTLDSNLLELLWNKYWVQTLSQSPLLTNRDFGNKQMLDLGSKIREATQATSRHAKGGGMFHGRDTLDAQMDNLARTSNTVAMKEKQGLMAGQIKAKIFNGASTPSS